MVLTDFTSCLHSFMSVHSAISFQPAFLLNLFTFQSRVLLFSVADVQIISLCPVFTCVFLLQICTSVSHLTNEYPALYLKFFSMVRKIESFSFFGGFLRVFSLNSIFPDFEGFLGFFFLAI